MSITVGHTTFERVRYDAEADILYLHLGDPGDAADFDESPEGHALGYDRSGRLVGMTVVGARRLLDEAEPIVIGIPEQVTIDTSALARAVERA
jgi:YD repeat-containing protein